MKRHKGNKAARRKGKEENIRTLQAASQRQKARGKTKIEKRET